VNVGRRRALAAGLLAAALYASGAAFSGHLSPLARRPLLDGLAPPTPYRWVEPPVELAATNEPPTPGRFKIRLGPEGSRTSVMTTDDAQVTWIAPKGAFAFVEGQRAVEVTIEPLAPSAASDPEPPLEIAGNVYLLEAAYRPSGDPAPLAKDSTIILLYPLLSNDHGGHAVLASETGSEWTALETSDLPSIQQADAELDVVGHVAVARTGSPNPSPQASEGDSTIGTILVSSAIAVLTFVAIYLIFGARRPSKRPGGCR
jgi:hypothetical protein